MANPDKFLPQLAPADIISEAGVLRSITHDDIYFSVEDGLAESRHVFLDGTSLRDALSTRSHLVIAETGFGTGLNLMAVLAEHAVINSACHIDYISFESRPLSADVVAAAHQPFPEIAAISREMCAKWPRRWPGVHRFDMAAGLVSVQLYYGRAEAVMPRLNFSADIWFLDGFSPIRNPDFWTEELMNEVGRLSCTGARLATFTVAALVRNGLASAGFEVEKRAGFGRKRDMLAAVKSDKVADGTALMPALAKGLNDVIIIGGGIAGAAIASQLRARGIGHKIIDAGQKSFPPASGNPAGIVMPFLSVEETESARLSISALSMMRQFVEENGLICEDGVIALDLPEVKIGRHEKLATQGYPADLMRMISAEEVTDLCGMPCGLGGLYHETACVIDPRRVCELLKEGSPVLDEVSVTGLIQEDDGWAVICDTARFTAKHVILCGGAGSETLIRSAGIVTDRLQTTSGQISLMPDNTGLSALTKTLNYGGYLIPARHQTQICGASFALSATTDITSEAHHHNLALMPEQLHASAGTIDAFSGRTSLRLAVTDRLPLSGQIAPGLSVLSCLGARGLTNALFLGDDLVRRLSGRPALMDMPLQAALDPKRLRAR